ncbi:MAG TPA: hypothetical protein DCL21_00470 [Alphaproteobacteria bacterium]|nr:hypothetical protein [Alphaproteobacteria bacterium]
MNKNLILAGFATLIASNASAITLKEGLDIVFNENPSLQSVKNELKVKEQEKKQAVSGFMPDVEAKYSLEDQNINLEGAPSGDASPSTGSVSLTQPLFTGGATLAGFKAAKYNEQAAESNYKLQQQNIFQSAASSYLSVMTAQEVLEFNTRQVATNTEEMKRIRQRFELGDITLPNLKEFEARLSGYIAEKEAAYGNLLAAKSSFITIFGRSADDLDWPKLQPQLPMSLEESLNLAKSNNPDVLQQKVLLKASKENINVARAGFMPTVAAVAAWSNNSNNFGATDTNVTSIGVQASLPLFKGGETTAKYKQSTYQKMQAEDALTQKIRDIEAQASNAYNDVQVQAQRVKALKVRLDSFRITTDAVEKQEEAGEASIIDVLDARDDEFSAKVDLQVAKQAFVLAKLELLASVGKFTYNDIDSIFNTAVIQETEVLMPVPVAEPVEAY